MLIEAFNGRLRDECLNVRQFASITAAQTKIEAWRIDYNQRRPHSSLGPLTPNQFAEQRQPHGSPKGPRFLVETCLLTEPTSHLAKVYF